MSVERDEIVQEVALDEEAAVAEAPVQATVAEDDGAAALERARNNSSRYSQSGRQQADATQLYLNEIGFSPLLTPEEEVHFARLARQGMKAAGAV